jgi:hypothetical protein
LAGGAEHAPASARWRGESKDGHEVHRGGDGVRLTLDAELTDDAIRAVANRVQGRPSPAPSETRELLEKQRVRIEHWLQKDSPLTLIRVQELLARDGITVPLHIATTIRA